MFFGVKSDDPFWWSIGGMFHIQMALHCSDNSYGQTSGEKKWRPYKIMVWIRGRYVIWAFPFLRCEFERVEVIQLDEQIAWGKRHIDAWLLGYLDF